jgi:hypothetical protein
LQIKIEIVSSHSADSKLVKQEVNGTIILPPLVFPALTKWKAQRHLRIDCLMPHATCLVCFISTVNGHCNKKRKEKKKLILEGLALVAGIQQILINLFWILSISMGKQL